MSMFFRRLFVGLLCLALYSGAGWLPLAGSGGGGGGTTTWDSSFSSSPDIAFSGGNLIASNQSANTSIYYVVRSIANHSSGKYYNEVTFSSSSGCSSSDLVIGWANGSATNNGALGFDANLSGGQFGSSTDFDINSTGVGATLAVFGLTTMREAIDTTGKLGWLAVNSGLWNNSGSANPATGSGGISLSAITGPYYAAVGLHGGSPQNCVATANFGAASPGYSFTPPSGFGAW